MAMYSRNANLQIFLSLYVKLSTDHLSTSNELSKVYVTDFIDFSMKRKVLWNCFSPHQWCKFYTRIQSKLLSKRYVQLLPCFPLLTHNACLTYSSFPECLPSPKIWCLMWHKENQGGAGTFHQTSICKRKSTMGGKESKQFPISYEEASKRGEKWTLWTWCCW